MVRLCYESRQPLQTFLQGTLQGGHLSADNMLTGQRQRVDTLPMPELLVNGFPQKKKTLRGSLLNRPSYLHEYPVV